MMCLCSGYRRHQISVINHRYSLRCSARKKHQVQAVGGHATGQPMPLALMKANALISGQRIKTFEQTKLVVAVVGGAATAQTNGTNAPSIMERLPGLQKPWKTPEIHVFSTKTAMLLLPIVRPANAFLRASHCPNSAVHCISGVAAGKRIGVSKQPRRQSPARLSARCALLDCLGGTATTLAGVLPLSTASCGVASNLILFFALGICQV